MEVREATIHDSQLIKHLAEKIWWPAYKGVLSDEQIDFMLANSYSEQALKQQFKDKHTFLLLIKDDRPIGFVSFSSTPNTGLYRLHKLYISEKGLGGGAFLLRSVEERARKQGAKLLQLNVNRKNTAKEFYEKQGFKIIAQEDILYHQFILDDYIMEKHL